MPLTRVPWMVLLMCLGKLPLSMFLKGCTKKGEKRKRWLKTTGNRKGVIYIGSIEVMCNLSFLGISAPRETKIAHNFPMDLNREKPHLHLLLHYFIHRVRQNCQANHFPILRERFLVSFFSKFWIWKTVDLMMSHNFCQRIPWNIAKGNVWAKFHIPTGCWRWINIFRKYRINHRENLNRGERQVDWEISLWVYLPLLRRTPRHSW